MKPTTLLFILNTTILPTSFGQTIELMPGGTVEKHLAKGNNHLYTITLKKASTLNLW
ncbi:MAG: hypothetical protein ICV51_10740 [Flavisolibacter sp.]|nr:hypothetical protein [Flavisolibacter sp.]MBD0376094.1 hypothetical protein [Flavisolibacter sp.]